MRKYIFYVPEENEPIGDVYYPDERDAPMPVEPLEMGRGTCKDISEQFHFHPTFKCSECGFGIDDWFTSDGYPYDDERFNFCPNCGRKVVRE